MSFVLSHFGKSFENVVALVCDNRNTNKCIAAKLKIPLNACANHHLQRAVREKVSDKKDIVLFVHEMIVKVFTPTMKASLFEHTPLQAKINNNT